MSIYLYRIKTEPTLGVDVFNGSASREFMGVVLEEFCETYMTTYIGDTNSDYHDITGYEIFKEVFVNMIESIKKMSQKKWNAFIDYNDLNEEYKDKAWVVQSFETYLNDEAENDPACVYSIKLTWV